MKHLKLFEEYRHIKVWPSKSNVKDPNEPFFNDPKYDYKRKKDIFGVKDISLAGNYKGESRIEVDASVIEDILRNEEVDDSLRFVLNKIRSYAQQYRNCMDDESCGHYLSSYLVFEELPDETVKQLRKLGFGIRIYDDSGEYSDSFGDKYRVIWIWKN
jgi:hypothetical protein